MVRVDSLASGIRVAMLCCLGLMIGCGGPAPKRPDAADQSTISGKVTLDGAKPVPLDTNVIFFNADKGATVSGKADALGNYSIQSADKTIGIPSGRYQIAVRPAPPPEVQINSEEYKRQMMSGGAPKKPENTSEIPERFHTLEQTKIVLEIKPGANTIDLDLSKF